HPREHALPGHLREERRGRVRPAGLPGVLLRGGLRRDDDPDRDDAAVWQQRLCPGADPRRQRRHRRRSRRLLRALSELARTDPRRRLAVPDPGLVLPRRLVPLSAGRGELRTLLGQCEWRRGRVLRPRRRLRLRLLPYEVPDRRRPGRTGRRLAAAESAGVNPTFQLGKIGGIRIAVNWSWLVIFGLIAWSLESTVFPDQDPHLSRTTYVVMGLVAALLFIVSLLLHELGHALVARREGIEIDGITLWLFGGVTRFKGTFGSPGAEFRVAVAGPLVSLALGGLSVGVALLVREPVSVQGVAAWLGYSNLLLFVFNMLPAAPLDGGRVLHAL